MINRADGSLFLWGFRGCLKPYASATAMTKASMGGINHGGESVGGRDGEFQLKEGETIIRSGLLANALKQGDALVTEIITDSADFLGYGLASVMNFYNPECIILGGGVIEAIDLLYERAVHRARVVALSEPARKTKILRPKLEDFSRVVGAACLGAKAAGFTFPLQ